MIGPVTYDDLETLRLTTMMVLRDYSHSMNVDMSKICF